jgi:hypothetical protein
VVFERYLREHLSGEMRVACLAYAWRYLVEFSCFVCACLQQPPIGKLRFYCTILIRVFTEVQRRIHLKKGGSLPRRREKIPNLKGEEIVKNAKSPKSQRKQNSIN